jgi:peptidoglycan-N-acetylglucosamine deacetylase
MQSMVIRGAARAARVFAHPFANVTARTFGTISRVETDEPAIAITFDDGPHPEFTPMLLRLLSSYAARGTFFCLGRYAEKYPAVIRQAAEAGHCIANHTYNHASMPTIESRERRKELRMCSQALRPYEQPFFRPPYGHQSIGSHIDAHRLGYQVIGWDVSGGDWSDKSAEWMAERMISRIRKGSILILHDRLSCAPNQAYFDRLPMIEALRLVLTRYKQYRFVTIPELLRLGRPVRVNWYWKADVNWLATLEGDFRESEVYSR